MSQHTPGPWEFHKEERYIESKYPNLNGEFEHICDFREDVQGNINETNAKLIAAAPLLYRALKRYMNVPVLADIGHKNALIDAINEGAAALAAAEPEISCSECGDSFTPFLLLQRFCNECLQKFASEEQNAL